MVTRTVLLAAALLALAGSPAARASEHDDTTLKEDVKVLTDMVRDLQRRVSALEARAAPAPTVTAAPSAAPVGPSTAQEAPRSAPQSAPIAAAHPGANFDYVSPEAVLKASWNQIEKGMDKSAIGALLGAPSTSFLLDGRLVWYYYYPGTGRGSVFFTDTGRVSSYQSPFLGFGW